jgi:DUF4097 and DUF4098 domain-containing protein YvlB
MEVENRLGAIRVTGTDADTGSWVWKLKVRALDDASAKKASEAATCAAEQTGDHLKLIVSLPETEGKLRFESDLEIQLPKSIAVKTSNRFGRTEISNLANDVDAYTQNGVVEIRNAIGQVRAETSFGSLTALGTGPATLRNRNGQIEARDIRGPLDAETSFAALTASRIEGPAILRNRNGRIEAGNIGGKLDAETSFASFDIRDISGPVRLRNRNGSVEIIRAGGDADIETSFAPLRAEEIQGNAILANRNGSLNARHIIGAVDAKTSFASIDIESASQHVTCRNQNGPIHIRATSTQLASLKAETSFGSLDVHLPGELNPVIQARTSFADVHSDFPILLNPQSVASSDSGQPGKPQINLHNRNGRIRVSRD